MSETNLLRNGMDVLLKKGVRPMNAKRIILTLIITAMGVSLSRPMVAQEIEGANPQSSKSEALVGSWTATFVSVDNPPSFPPIPVLLTINADGTMVETDGSALVPFAPDPNTGLTYTSPGHGVWQFPGGKFAIKFVQIVAKSDNTLFATGTLQFDVVLDGKDHFHSTGTFKFVDTAGNVLAAGEEQLNGQRIQ
jgi:hypothetical protein